MTLDECREIAGTLRAVCYYPSPGARPEYGEVTSCSDVYAFVLYDGQRNAKATRPEDLYLATQAPA